MKLWTCPRCGSNTTKPNSALGEARCTDCETEFHDDWPPIEASVLGPVVGSDCYQECYMTARSQFLSEQVHQN